MGRSVSWAPTIALSWLWGLGFFFSFHMTLTYGWLGFAAFAAPNAFGLFAFGWILGDPRRDPAMVFKTVQARYSGLFLACQVLAVAITIFASVAYLFIPLFGAASLVIVAVFVLLATAVGHAATMNGLKWLHVAYLAVGLLAAAFLLFGLAASVPAHHIPLVAFDGRFYGLMMPSLVGFLLGPWTDVQHWQRALAIRAEGGSVRRAYTWGALLFLGLITMNAALAAAAGPALVVVTSDGLPGMQAAVAGAITKFGSGSLAIAFAIWAGVAIASTLDSFYFATRWLLRATARESSSPLMAFVPTGIVTSPIWFLVTALLIAVYGVVEHVAMIFLMIAYATLFVGAATCLVCEVVSGEKHYDGMLCALIGVASVLIFAVGYLGDMPGFVAIAPLVGLIGAFTALRHVVLPSPKAVMPSPPAVMPSSGGAKVSSAVAVLDRQALDVREPAVTNEGLSRSYGFEGQWFVLHLTPTYDDTNSVGNVYFANYFRWVGKARELMFNACMPSFDLRATDFYILTKSFEHEFRREVREFEPVTVRLKIDSFNRKFATIIHELHAASGPIGRGQQTIMFVDTATYRPMDIPAVIMQSFLPYYTPVPKTRVAPRGPVAPVSPIPAE